MSEFKIEEGLPDIISKVRFDGIAPNTPLVRVAIVIPADFSKPVYGDIVAEVKAFSKTKSGFHYRGIFNIRALNQRQARQKVGVLAGALAENLTVVYHDQIDPVEYANEAMKAWDNALARFEAKQFTPLPRDQLLSNILVALNKLGMLA